ncbi:PR domain zinc finger protein 15-like [Melitaea cinxia]|uniref:PR domain zinc finger protein 15-like n=1 Tax=Melitaea cinxia TaxID=113334 RepID=UPI001E26F851|nr:PR domain zinc finger protein 15-like [Melitaea cinxia]
MRCCVQSCINDTRRTTKSHGITFHMFPKELSLRTAWIEALGLNEWEPKERSAVCSEHFQQDAFYETKCGLRRIKNGAVPLPLVDLSEDLDAPATLRVCRICLTMDAKMYHMSDHKLSLVYEQVTGVPVNIDDKLPQKLCYECAARLRSANVFRSKALRTQGLLLDKLDADRFMTIRDVKSISRAYNKLISTLGQKIYEVNDCDLHINDNEVIKIEREASNDNDNEEIHFNDDDEEIEDFKNDIEIKDESNNEIFFEEYPVFDSDDDRTLSVLKKKSRVKKKKVKVEKKVREVKEVREKKRCEEDNPSTTMDKYKKSDVKRRKTTDGLDESLFTITTLTYEEQIAEVERRQEASAYKHAPYKCTTCYRGFQIRDRYDAHVVRHSEQSGAYECFICKTRLKTARALRKHLTAQHTEKFSCKGCPFVTRNRGVAREHEKWHAGTKYQCPHCPSEFDKLTTYMGHIRIKHVSDFVCELCGYTFVSKKGIDVHKKKKHRLADKTVSLEGPYCEVCEVRFISEEAHSRHLKLSSRHSSDNDP